MRRAVGNRTLLGSELFAQTGLSETWRGESDVVGAREARRESIDHDRGLGRLLFERLLAVAREWGRRVFVASCAPVTCAQSMASAAP